MLVKGNSGKGKEKKNFKQMGARRAQLLCLQHCAQVNMPKPIASGAVTSSRPELACVQWHREQERLLGLPAPLGAGTTKRCLYKAVLSTAGLCEGETSLCVVKLLDFTKQFCVFCKDALMLKSVSNFRRSWNMVKCAVFTQNKAPEILHKYLEMRWRWASKKKATFLPFSRSH